MSLIIWIIVGALAGWIASMLMGKDQQMGAVANIVVGMVGSLIGGFVVTLFTKGNADITTAFTEFNLTSIIVSVLGAVILLAILKFFKK